MLSYSRRKKGEMIGGGAGDQMRDFGVRLVTTWEVVARGSEVETHLESHRVDWPT